jgi:hypothetical protein
MSPSPLSISDNWTLDNNNFDKQTLLATIVTTGGRFEPLYSDPEYFRFMSAQWWNKWQRNFLKWFDALDIEYNPLENYDRMEQWHEDTTDGSSETTEYGSDTVLDHDGSYSKKGNDKITEDDTDDIQESGTTTVVTRQNGTLRAPGASGLNGSTTTNEVSAFDASGYSAHDKSTTNTNKSEDTTVDTTETTTPGKKTLDKDLKITTRNWGESGSDSADDTTTVEGTSATDRSADRDFDHSGRVHGNIGVTTSQQMLQSELDLQLWNVYQHIADIFCKEMLITVY